MASDPDLPRFAGPIPRLGADGQSRTAPPPPIAYTFFPSQHLLYQHRVLHLVCEFRAVVVDWYGALDNESRYLSTLLADVRDAIKKGKSMEQTIGEATQTEQGKWVLFDIVNRRNISLVFPVLEWE